MSRPSSYKKRYASEASKLCLVGATDQILAEHFGVSTQTISNWKNSKPEFFEAIKDAKQKADSQVQKSLFKRATGYKTTQTRTISDEEGKQVKVEKVTKDVAPDPRAGKLWLRNRQPEEWRDDTNTLVAQQANQLHKLQQQVKELHKLQQQVAQDKHYIQKLETELKLVQDDYTKLYVSSRAREEVIGADLMDQIFEAMLVMRDKGNGFSEENFTLDVDRFKACLISLAVHQSVLSENQKPEIDDFGF